MKRAQWNLHHVQKINQKRIPSWTCSLMMTTTTGVGGPIWFTLTKLMRDINTNNLNRIKQCRPLLQVSLCNKRVPATKFLLD